MLILLPPSETKHRPDEEQAAPLRLASLSEPTLLQAREELLELATRTATRADGAELLGVPASAPELRARMEHIRTEPVAPALSVYTGVLYDALAHSAPAPMQIPEGTQILITSALLGVVDAVTDEIPAYRLSASSRLVLEDGSQKTAGAWWRPHLKQLGVRLASEHDLILDCRSGGYRSMMPVPGALEVKAVRDKGGRRTVISHDAKRYRGLLTGALLGSDSPLTSAEELVDFAREHLGSGLDVELGAGVLTIIDRVE